MATQVKSASEYYQYLDLVQKTCNKLKSIEKNKVKIIYENFNMEICKYRLNKEIEKIDRLIEEQKDLSI